MRLYIGEPNSEDIMQAIFEQNQIAEFINNKEVRGFGDKIGVIASVFGCWHMNLTRPFISGDEAYRACLHCGARKHYDTESLQTYGSFYFPPEISLVTENR
jgi:hypothetical protein